MISNVIPPLKTSDTIQKSLERMTEFKLYHLPIVNENQFLGLASLNELIEVKDKQMQLAGLSLTMLKPFIYNDAHLYDLIKVFKELQVSVLPVLNQQNEYIGLISIYNLLTPVANMYAINEPGGVIVLTIDIRNNSLSQIAQIVESDNAQILSSYVNTTPNLSLVELTLKINKTELSSIIAAFERYSYEIKAVYNNTQYDNYTDRFNSFMNYLNV